MSFLKCIETSVGRDIGLKVHTDYINQDLGAWNSSKANLLYTKFVAIDSLYHSKKLHLIIR